jgi:cytochrome c-type biogenesis protein CcmH
VGRAVSLASGQRALGILIVALALGFSLAAESRQITKEQVEEITSNLVCLCGCGNKTVSVCGCGVADATIKEVQGMLNEGKTAEQIFAHYVDSTGIAVLASPPKKGFNLLAWVLPFAGILIAGVFLLGKIRDWQKDLEKKEAARDKAQSEPNQPTATDPHRKRLAKELEKIA